MELKFRLGASDLQAARAHNQKQLGWRNLRQGFGRALVAGILIGMLWHMRSGSHSHWAWALVILALAAQAIRTISWARSGRPAQAGREAEGEYELTLGPEGLIRRAPDGRSGFYGWPEIAALETTDNYLYFHLIRESAIAVPRASLAGAGATDFANTARKLWEAHSGNRGQTLPALPGIPETPAYQLLVNLHQAARLVFFFKFDSQAFRVSWAALFWLLLADVCWMGVTDYIQALPMPVFNWAGLGAFGISLLLFFGWAAAVSGLMAQFATLLRLLVVAESSLLLISLFYDSLDVKLGQQQSDGADLWLAVFALVSLLWMTVALVRVIRGMYSRSYFAALFMGGAYVLLSITQTLLFPDGELYVNAAMVQSDNAAARHAGKAAAGKAHGGKLPAPGLAATEDEGDGDGNIGDDGSGDGGDDGEDDGEGDDELSQSAQLDVEDIYYRQPAMVRHMLEGVKPRRPGETGLYFVGFAGDASEHEFGNEVRYARGLLDRRFNTAGRSLVLINSYDSVSDTPLANTHNMEAVLQGLAGRMDRKNDVLFLFLSSHGAQDHRLAVSFSPLEMNDLKAEKLKELLDKSGIRNRVIVVSACYSGGFLDVLKDDNTLILTASRRDHVAYGCGDITEYTYFGEAYFVQALEHSDSFISAFDEARNRIAAREKSEGEEASGPQIHVGRNIVRVLQKLKVRHVGLKAEPADDGEQRCPENCPGEPG